VTPVLSLPAIPVLVLAAVFILIAVRQVGGFHLRIWQIMCIGAVAVLLFGQISPVDALRAINPDVMVFLLGMFIVGEALEQSGYLDTIAFRIFARARTGRQFILTILLFMGTLSALLMNDTIAIIATPVVISYACRFGLDPKRALLALCFAVTTGSVASPIGNPQNLLIATYSGISQPFIVFFLYLALPTLVNLLVAYLFLTHDLPGKECDPTRDGKEYGVRDQRLASISRLSLAIILALIAVRVLTGPALIPLSFIALAGAVPCCPSFPATVCNCAGHRLAHPRIFRSNVCPDAERIQHGFFQSGIDFGAITSLPLVLGTSVVISQFISNVPFVALFLPLIAREGMSVASLMALAAGSTIAGNLTILGAASNVIIIENAERRGYTLTFWEFLRVGLPLTAVNVIVYGIFLSLV